MVVNISYQLKIICTHLQAHHLAHSGRVRILHLGIPRLVGSFGCVFVTREIEN
jgi:hypothetical protein